jgi:hypothetical protein
VRGSIDDHIRRDGTNRSGETFQIGEIATQLLAIGIQRDQLSQWRKTALQFPADLAVFAEEKDLHQNATSQFVIPAQAGIQSTTKALQRGDKTSKHIG